MFAFSPSYTQSTCRPWIMLGGAFSAYGSELANGCTCAHVIAGAPRLAKRSVSASVVLFTTMFVLFQLERLLL